MLTQRRRGAEKIMDRIGQAWLDVFLCASA